MIAQTLQSAPLKDVTIDGQVLVASVSDLGRMMTPAALNTNPNPTTTPPPGSQDACIAAAYAQHKIACDAAHDTAMINSELALAGFVGCCGLVALGTGFTGIGALIGVAICGLLLAAALVGVEMQLASSLRAARASLEASLLACGVVIYVY